MFQMTKELSPLATTLKNKDLTRASPCRYTLPYLQNGRNRSRKAIFFLKMSLRVPAQFYYLN